MKILTISDTHNKHNQIPSKYIDNINGEIDMIIHAGDMTMGGDDLEVEAFLEWYDKLNFKYKIYTLTTLVYHSQMLSSKQNKSY